VIRVIRAHSFPFALQSRKPIHYSAIPFELGIFEIQSDPNPGDFGIADCFAHFGIDGLVAVGFELLFKREWKRMSANAANARRRAEATMEPFYSVGHYWHPREIFLHLRDC